MRPHSALADQTPQQFAESTVGPAGQGRLALKKTQTPRHSHYPCSGNWGQVTPASVTPVRKPELKGKYMTKVNFAESRKNDEEAGLIGAEHISSCRKTTTPRGDCLVNSVRALVSGPSQFEHLLFRP